jgi:hypothetical protein
VLLSPHGRESGIYAANKGSLEPFGVPGFGLDEGAAPPSAARLAEIWGRPLLHEPLDHGAMVPLSLVARTPPVLVATIAEHLSPQERIDEGQRFSAALTRLAEHEDVFFLASLNTSAGLSARAPLTELPEGRRLDERIVSSLRSGDQPDDPAMWEKGHSCGAGPFAAWLELFGKGRVVSYEYPFGVGYLVAVADE